MKITAGGIPWYSGILYCHQSGPRYTGTFVCTVNTVVQGNITVKGPKKHVKAVIFVKNYYVLPAQRLNDAKFTSESDKPSRTEFYFKLRIMFWFSFIISYSFFFIFPFVSFSLSFCSVSLLSQSIHLCVIDLTIYLSIFVSFLLFISISLCLSV